MQAPKELFQNLTVGSKNKVELPVENLFLPLKEISSQKYFNSEIFHYVTSTPTSLLKCFLLFKFEQLQQKNSIQKFPLSNPNIYPSAPTLVFHENPAGACNCSENLCLQHN